MSIYLGNKPIKLPKIQHPVIDKQDCKQAPFCSLNTQLL